MKELYVVNCCRTAVGSFGGSLKNTPAAELGSIVVKEALKRANVAPENVDEVMFGCILTAGLGQNVARQVCVGAGLPYSVPAYTVGMVCGSGMKSVIEAGRAILAGDADIIVCGGTENMSAAPFASFDERWGARMGDKKLVDTMIKDGLWDAFNNYHMGTTAENICDVWGITREELDAFGAASQQKTEAAQKAGRFDDEIVPVPVKVKKEIVEFKKDEFPRAGSTVEGLAKLRTMAQTMFPSVKSTCFFTLRRSLPQRGGAFPPSHPHALRQQALFQIADVLRDLRAVLHAHSLTDHVDQRKAADVAGQKGAGIRRAVEHDVGKRVDRR